MHQEREPNLFDTPIEIAPGEFKRLGECTRPDLHAAEELAHAQRKQAHFLHELMLKILDLVSGSGVESVSELPYTERELNRLVDDSAASHGISPEVARDITHRELGWPEHV